jgi:hypothetical protein
MSETLFAFQENFCRFFASLAQPTEKFLPKGLFPVGSQGLNFSLQNGNPFPVGFLFNQPADDQGLVFIHGIFDYSPDAIDSNVSDTLTNCFFDKTSRPFQPKHQETLDDQYQEYSAQ